MINCLVDRKTYKYYVVIWVTPVSLIQYYNNTSTIPVSKDRHFHGTFLFFFNTHG